MTVLALLSRLLIPHVLATLPTTICTGLPGCSGGTAGNASNLLYSAAVEAYQLMGDVAVGCAVVGMIYAGVMMLIANGDESKVTKAKDGMLYALGGAALFFSASSLVSFLVTEDFGRSAASGTEQLIPLFLQSASDIGIAIFNGGLILVLIYAGFRMIFAQGAAEEFKKGTTIIKWALIGAIVVHLARAIVYAFFSLPIWGM